MINKKIIGLYFFIRINLGQENDRRKVISYDFQVMKVSAQPPAAICHCLHTWIRACSRFIQEDILRWLSEVENS